MENNEIIREAFSRAKKVDNVYKEFVDIYYTKNGEVTNKITKSIKFRSFQEMFEAYDFGMTKFVFYSRPVGLLEDIEVLGEPENFGRVIYFGKRMSVMDYNMTHIEKLMLPLTKNVIVCDNGEVITDLEPMAATNLEVMAELNRFNGLINRNNMKR